MGQAHAGVKGAGDVEPEQRPLLLRNPLSGPCQKQRFCSPGNIPPCLSQILPKILLLLKSLKVCIFDGTISSSFSHIFHQISYSAVMVTDAKRVLHHQPQVFIDHLEDGI